MKTGLRYAENISQARPNFVHSSKSMDRSFVNVDQGSKDSGEWLKFLNPRILESYNLFATK